MLLTLKYMFHQINCTADISFFYWYPSPTNTRDTLQARHHGPNGHNGQPGSQTPGSEPWYVVRGAGSVVVASDFEMFLSGYEKWNCTNCSCTASVCMGIGWVCAHTDILTHSSARLIDARKQFTHWKKRLQSTTSAVRERNSAATCRAATKNYRK